MRIGALVEHTVFGVLWLLWKGGTWLGLRDGGSAFGPGAPMVMPDEFAPVVPTPPPGATVVAAEEPEAPPVAPVAPVAPVTPVTPPVALVGHRRSKTLHLSTCRYAPPSELARPFSERASAEADGFRFCKVCRPT